MINMNIVVITFMTGKGLHSPNGYSVLKELLQYTAYGNIYGFKIRHSEVDRVTMMCKLSQ